MNYRRSYLPGGTFFFTLVTYKREKLFANPKNIDLFRAAINKVKLRHPFTMSAYVLLPDHFHCIWTLPDSDSDYSMRWRLIKSYFTRDAVFPAMRVNTVSRKNKSEQCIWQRRFWEHAVKDEADFANHVDYIHYNPVKHGYVNKPADWLHSSIHYYIKNRIYPVNWGCAGVAEFVNIAE